jgi:hypothetical protein
VIGLLVLAATCELPVNPVTRLYDEFPEAREEVRFDYDRLRPLAPPDSYRELYTEIRACLAGFDFPLTDLEFEEIRFWVADEFWIMYRGTGSGYRVAGVWLKSGDLVLDGEDVEDMGLVGHELIHALLLDGEGAHPALFWSALAACGR